MRDCSLAKLLERHVGAWIGLPRSTGSHGPDTGRKAWGGIGFLIVNPKLRAQRIRQNCRGALMIKVAVPGAAPVAIIGVYNPPLTSQLNTTSNGEYSRGLLDDVRAMYTEAMRKYDTVLLVGDFNARLGNLTGLHESEDSNAHNDKRRKDMVEFCQQLRVLPLHGRPAEIKAPAARWISKAARGARGATGVAAACTSKPIEAQKEGDPFVSEVDYIMADVDMQRGSYVVAPPQEEVVGTHRPVAALIRLQPVAETAVKTRRSRGRRVPLADYGDREFWGAAAEELATRAADAINQLGRGANLDEELALVQRVYVKAAAAAQSSVKGGRYSRQAAFAHRFRGHRMPPNIEMLFAEARRARKAFTAARSVLCLQVRGLPSSSWRLSRSGSPELHALYDTYERARNVARKAATKHLRQILSAALRDLETQRVRNAHQFANRLQRLTPDATTAPAQGAIPGDCETFVSHFEKLATETRPDASIPGMGVNADRYAACFPAKGAHSQFAHVLEDPITAEEVGLAKDPVHPKTQHVFPLKGHDDCKICALDKTQVEDWARKLKAAKRAPVQVPRINCRLWGGKASGSAGLFTEHLRFPRPNLTPEQWHSQGHSVFDWRARINTMLARVFETWRRLGRVPKSADFVESVLTPIHKQGDAADPNNYRGIATGNVIPKLFGLVLLRRLTHWCSLTGVIPPNQAGFMPYNSAEGHVFALLETLKARARNKVDTYLLFLDLKKAYDSVHQGALWHILAKLGVPASFITLLRDWNSRRPTRVKFNGELSREFLATKGLPQGDVLSPLLFNLFISVLMRLIQNSSTYHGAAWPAPYTLRLRDLWYADDMVGIAESVPQLQALLDIIREWSSDWGLDVGIGQGKTNAMHVSTTSPSSDAELRFGAHVIEWTDTYRYLGYLLNRDLSNGKYWGRIVDRINHSVHQYVTGNSAVRHLSIASQLQVFNTHVLGSVTYLLPIIPLSEKNDRDRLDGAIRTALRKVLGAHKSCSNASIHADTRAIPIDALALQHRLRFRLELQRTVATGSPAVLVYRQLEEHAASQNVARERRFLGSWTSITAAAIARFQDLAGPLPGAPEKRMDEHAYTTNVAHMYAYAVVRGALGKDLPVDHTAATLASDAFQEQLPAGEGCTKAYQAGLHYIGNDDRRQAGERGPVARLDHIIHVNGGITSTATPISAWGPGLDGSPIALSSRLSAKQCRVIQYVRLGRDALTYWPFMQPRHQQPAAGGAGSAGDGQGQSAMTHQSARQAFHNNASMHICPFGCGAHQNNPVHFATTCTSPLWRDYQGHLRSRVRKLLKGMVALLRKACGDFATAEFIAAAAQLRQQLDATTPAHWTTDDYIHVIIRLLSCAPFSAFDVRMSVPRVASAPSNTRPKRAVVADREEMARALAVADAAGDGGPSRRRPPAAHPDDMPLSRALGAMFDHVRLQRSYLRPWANSWTQWSYKCIMELAGHYNCLRGVHRADVPCHAHHAGDEYRRLAQLHVVDHLGHDAAVVEDDEEDAALDDPHDAAGGEEDP